MTPNCALQPPREHSDAVRPRRAASQEKENHRCEKRVGRLTHRSRSHSPSRRAPKLHHTNGRLESAPLATCRPDSAAGHQEHHHGHGYIKSTPTLPMARERVSRSVSYDVSNTRQRICAERRSRQLYIFRRDAGFRQLCSQNTRRLMVMAKSYQSNAGERDSAETADAAATNDQSSSSECGIPTDRQRSLALKALKYRNLLATATNLDKDRLRDPSFDVLEHIQRDV